ncbi:MAG: alpha/beta hydrolase [Sandaracinaceae bacterium]|nr:alpha/beta hydrolase [Sandaracinaceae bacterium]
MHVRRFGEGPPLLLVHGLMTSSYSWRYVLAPLGARYTCYAPDLRGTGAASPASRRPSRRRRWPTGSAPCRTRSRSRAARASRTPWAATSRKWAALRGVPFRSLVSVHAPGVPEARIAALGAALAVPGASTILGALVARDPERWCHANVHYWDESLKSLEEAREYAAPLRTADGRRAFAKHLGETMALGPMRRMHALLAERRARGEPFPCPLLLVYAKRDPMVPPRFGPIFAERIPSARLVLLDEASHFAHVDAPERFLPPVLAFLDETAG